MAKPKDFFTCKSVSRHYRRSLHFKIETMKPIFLFLIVLVAATAFQCSRKKMPTLRPDQPYVSLSTSGCRGFCPVFRLDVLQGGVAVYTPERYCAVAEPRKFQLTEAELAALRERIKTIPYQKYPSYIESTIADAPGATLTFHQPDTSFSITGTIDRPKSLLELENHLRDIALAHGVDTRKAYDPNEIPPGSASELLVLLKEEVNAGNWISQIQVGNPRLIRRIPPNNAWVLSFDHTQIGIKDMIAVLEGSVDVIRVQRNMRTDPRRD